MMYPYDRSQGWGFWVVKFGGSGKRDVYSKYHYFDDEGRIACGKVYNGKPLWRTEQLEQKGRCAACHRLIAGCRLPDDKR